MLLPEMAEAVPVGELGIAWEERFKGLHLLVFLDLPFSSRMASLLPQRCWLSGASYAILIATTSQH